ncbi:type VII secretion protein EccB [Nocardia arthritidis]|nr:type VII secretion protein EccB [Nocardia arthritidis]
MPSKPTTRWQVSGYRFLVRRMEHALVRRDVRMLHDPMRSQSRAYAAGLIMAFVVLAGCGVLALLRPQDKIGSHTILIGKDSGTAYAVIDGVVHPALNLSSAKLAANKAEGPVTVKESELGSKPLGSLIGIPGAPGAIHFDKDGKGQTWTVCDAPKGDTGTDRVVTVIVGGIELGDKASNLPKDKALLVQGKDSVYLIYNNRRARVNMKDPAVTYALNLANATPRPISEGLLNAIPEYPAIEPPTLTDGGGVPTYAINGHRIGDVVQVTTSVGTTENYAVLRDGLQKVSPFTAELIRAANPPSSTNSMIDSSTLAKISQLQTLKVDTYPEVAPQLISAREAPDSCISWKPKTAVAKDSSGDRAELTVITGVNLPLADNAKPLTLAQSNNKGLLADQFYMKPGTGAYVQTTGIEPDSRRKDSIFYIADTGVRFGIKNTDSAKALGLEDVQPEPAPYPIVGLIAIGPTLGREEALVAHDGVAADPNPGKTLVADPKK